MTTTMIMEIIIESETTEIREMMIDIMEMEMETDRLLLLLEGKHRQNSRRPSVE